MWKLQLSLAIIWCLAMIVGLIYLCVNYLPVLLGVSFVVIFYGTFWAVGTVKYWLDRL